MVATPYNAQTQWTTCFDQHHFLSRQEIQMYEKGALIAVGLINAVIKIYNNLQ